MAPQTEAANQPPSVQVAFLPVSMIRQKKGGANLFTLNKVAVFGEMHEIEQEFIDAYLENVTHLQLVRGGLDGILK